MIFNKITCWNIFDHTNSPEPLWNLQRQGRHREARCMARSLTIRHPFRMIPVIIQCHRG